MSLNLFYFDSSLKLSPIFFSILINVFKSVIIVNRIIGVMVKVLASSLLDRRLQPQLSQTKDYEIGICCFSIKHAALMR